MSFKEQLQKEQKELLDVKRPYESAAFIIFAVLFLQQLFFIVRSLWRFISKDATFFSTANTTAATNMQGFFIRIVNIDSTKWSFIILGLLALVLYYFLIYLFVWNFCRKRGLPKWTWTTFVVFGPTIFLAPPFIWFVIYAFREYFFRFIKRVVEEYKNFNPTTTFKEEEPDPEPVVEEEVIEEEVVEEELEVVKE